MSETAPERPGGGGRENVLTHKLGPMPTWAWIAIAAAVLIGWAYYRNKQASNASAANTTAAGSTSAADVPQFVNQTYTTVTPPTAQAPSVTVNENEPGTPTPILTPGLPNPKPVAAKPGPSQQPPIFNASYTVLKGETLASIAKKYGITRVELAHANGLGTGAGLRTGQKLKVPNPAPKGTPNKAI